MEVTFGAVGDFISIGVLIKDFIELLDDSRGSAWEYNSLKQQLTFLRLNLDLAKRSYDEYYKAPQFQDIRNTLESVVDEAERRLEDIAVKVQKYTSTLSEGSAERRIKKVARKKDQSDTQQLVSKLQKDFDDRFSSLEDELRAVKTMSGNTQQCLVDIGMVVTRRLDIVTQTVNSLGIAVLRGVSGMSYLGTSVLSLLSTMHTNIMGRLERPPHMGPFFTFEDYLGVDSIILLNFVDSWNAFEGSLHGKFKGRKGGRRVAQNRFLLQDHQTGDEIDRDAHWSLAITPGSRINMSLICEVKEDEDEAQSLKCPFPSCGAMCEGVIGTVIQCPSCQQLFRKLPGMSDDEDLPAAPNAPDSGVSDPSLKLGSDSSDLGQSRKRKGTPLDKRRALWAKRKPTDARNTGSDSDDADLTGIKRVTVLPILRLAIRPTPPPSETEQRFEVSEQQIAPEEQEKSSSLNDINENASIESPSSTMESQPGGKNKRVSELQSESHVEQLGSGTTYMSGIPYQRSDGQYEYPYDKIPGPGEYFFNSMWPGGFTSKDPRRRYAATRVPQRPSTIRDTGSKKEKNPAKRKRKRLEIRKATEADAKRHKIPAGYSLKHWDPSEEPVMLLGSVFDANSFGKWLFDWSAYAHGPSTPTSDMAGEFWLLLIQLSGKLKRAYEIVGSVKSVDSKELVDDFIAAGERLWTKLLSLLKTCEAPMLEAYKLKERKRKNTAHNQGGNEEKTSQQVKIENDGLGREFEKTSVPSEGGNIEETEKTRQTYDKNAGVAFVETIFGEDKELKRTERLIRNMRLWSLRFDANCENIVRNPLES
ncbi:vegetative cell wall gp1 [Fusarium mundagurra]|uniref:Vegetative cell wall gp1 n=1 Tax=Fusarium mundagurra TaxID=1567541 RepID=A0A8H6D497_9HYPO|nr:vegetative cell wall gp1 [Fusarium mundagurra]